MEDSAKNNIFIKVAEIVIWLLIVLVLANYILLGASFDGAMNLLPAKNLALHGDYYSYYFRSYFAYPIQTRFTLQMPSALVYFLFGVNRFTYTLVPALYTLVFLWLTKKLLVYLSGDKLAILFLPLFLLIPRFIQVGIKGWGEIIAFTFVLAGLYVLIKGKNKKSKRYLICGIFVGIGIVTKTITLIVLPAFFILYVYDFWKSKTTIKAGFQFLLGLLIPILLYSIFQFVLMGPENYSVWANSQINGTITQAGVSDVQNWEKKDPLKEAGIFSQAITRYKLTAEVAKLNPIAFTTLLLLFYIGSIYFLWSDTVKKRNKRFLLFTLVLCSIYFIWWFFMTPYVKMSTLGKFRRVLPAFIFLVMGLCVLISLIKNIIDKRNNRLGSIFLIGSTIFLSLLLFSKDNFNDITLNPKRYFSTPIKNKLKKRKAFNDTIDKLIDSGAKVFGHGYKHSPGIALQINGHLENIFSYDIDEFLIFRNKYFVLDAYSMSTNTFSGFLDAFENETVSVLKNNKGKVISKLIKISALKEFPIKDKSLLKGCIDDLKNYPLVKGKLNSKWYLPVARIHMKGGTNCALGVTTLFMADNGYYFDGSGDYRIILEDRYQVASGILKKGQNKVYFKIPKEIQNLESYEIKVMLDSYYFGAKRYFGFIWDDVCLKCDS